MLNFLFSALCACGAVFGSFLTYRGVTGGGYEAVIAGGVFLFGSLLTFGIGQIHRLVRAGRRQAARLHATQRTGPVLRTEPRPTSLPREEPEVFSERAEPIIPHPVLERVASRFARPER